MHPGHGHEAPAQPKPLVFLDKSDKIVDFQLARLPSSQLLLIERTTDDAKYRPVYQAILIRPGLARQDREEAVKALTTLNRSTPVDELLSAIDRLDWGKRDQRTVVNQLSEILLKQLRQTLAAHKKAFEQAATSKNAASRAVAYAGLIAAGETDSAWSLAGPTEQGKQDFLASVAFVSPKERAGLRERILSCLARSEPVPVRRSAVEALGFVGVKQAENFGLVAELVAYPQLRTAAVRTMLQIPKEERPVEDARAVVEALLTIARNTPPARRTTPDFLDAMQLADELLARLPVEEARTYRGKLREVVVRVVRINTVHEEMRYDTPYFAVEAGRPVQIVLCRPPRSHPKSTARASSTCPTQRKCCSPRAWSNRTARTC
jgi:hypothetical protein